MAQPCACAIREQDRVERTQRMLGAGPDLFGLRLPFDGLSLAPAAIGVVLASQEGGPAMGEPVDAVAFADAAAALIASAHASGWITSQSASTLARGLRELSGWAQLSGATTVADLEDLAPRWVRSPDVSHSGRVVDAALATQHRRRFVVDWIWRQARSAGLTSVDPCRDLQLPARPDPAPVVLTDEEVDRLDLAASTLASTRKPAIYAAVASGVPADLVLSLEAAHVDLAAGLIRIDGRELPLEGPHLAFLDAHLAAGVDPTLPGMPDPRILYRGGADPASQQAQVGTVLGELGARAGVPHVTASRLNAWAARRAFDRAGGRIEVAAALLGVRSLDTAAARIGWDWR